MMKYLTLPALLLAGSNLAAAQTATDFSDVRDRAIASCIYMADIDYSAKNCSSEKECAMFKALDRLGADECDRRIDAIIKDLTAAPAASKAEAFDLSSHSDPLDGVLTFMLTNELVSREFAEPDGMDVIDFNIEKSPAREATEPKDHSTPPPAPIIR